MSLLAFEAPSSSASVSHPSHGRRHRPVEDSLILAELNPHAVIDQALNDQAVTLTSVGTVREACPKCQHTHLSPCPYTHLQRRLMPIQKTVYIQ